MAIFTQYNQISRNTNAFDLGPMGKPSQGLVTKAEHSFCSWEYWPILLSFFICSIMSPVRNNVGRGLNIALVNGKWPVSHLRPRKGTCHLLGHPVELRTRQGWIGRAADQTGLIT